MTQETLILDTTCTQVMQVTVKDLRRLVKREGGAREKAAPVAGIERTESSNTADAVDATGAFLFSFGIYADGRLTICG